MEGKADCLIRVGFGDRHFLKSYVGGNVYMRPTEMYTLKNISKSLCAYSQFFMDKIIDYLCLTFV